MRYTPSKRSPSSATVAQGYPELPTPATRPDSGPRPQRTEAGAREGMIPARGPSINMQGDQAL